MSEQKSIGRFGDKERTRNWTFVAYPESAPENWRLVLDKCHVPWIESPLHDKDLNADGKPKKPHWHILLMFEGKKSYEQISEISSLINGTRPERVKNIQGIVRYFVHMDNPEKYRYSESQLVAHSGADIADYLKITVTNKRQLMREMQAFIRKQNVLEFCDLVDYAAENRPDDWYVIIAESCTYHMSEYIKSRRFQFDQMRERKRKVNLETGEVISDE